MSDIDDRPHWVYEFIGTDGLHLYVGITVNLGQRFLNHYGKPWWNQVARIESTQVPTRAAALASEAELVRRFAPPHNLNMTEHANPRGWSGRRENIEAWHAAGLWCRDSVCADCTDAAHADQVSCFRAFHCRECLEFIPYRYALDEPREADCWRELARRHGGEEANHLTWTANSASQALALDQGERRPVYAPFSGTEDARAYALRLARQSAAVTQ